MKQIYHEQYLKYIHGVDESILIAAPEMARKAVVPGKTIVLKVQYF